MFKCNAKSKVETGIVDENGFEPSSNDAKFPAKGLEKHNHTYGKRFQCVHYYKLSLVLEIWGLSLGFMVTKH